MKNLMKVLFSFALVAMTAMAMGQGTVTGTVVDAADGSPLPGATVQEDGTSNGTISGQDGTFSIETVAASGQLSISFLGYGSQSVSFTAGSDVGTISLAVDAESIDEVVVVGVGIIDIAKDRETPVAVSTIKLPEIVAKTGNQEFPDIMKNTPSVYVGNQAGGYGDSRINIRGFSQENLALLFNGQPVNGMEDGKVYWSNWQGLAEIANAVQIQRGLGSSKLAISSVGATINVITKATDMQAGGRISALYGNDNYMKFVASASTGVGENGWGASILLSHWQGNGYNDGTQGQGQTYFFSIGFKPSDKHKFNFSVTGAPQNHYQNYQKSISTYDRDGDGVITNTEQRFNDNWGYMNGSAYTWRENFYHKPVANLNWDWNISKKSTLSTVLYASTGAGGGTGPYGNYGIYNYTRDAEGQVDFDGIIGINQSIPADADGKIYGSLLDDGSSYGDSDFAARRASMNMHRWLGTVINFNHELSEHLSFNVGADFRTYFGEHFRLADNMLGLDGFLDEGLWAPGYKTNYPGGQVYTQEHTASPYMFWTERNSMTGDKLDYFNTERISYAGAFGQVEYKNDRVSAFVQGALSTQSYQRFDYFNYSDPDEIASEKLHFPGYNVKAGANFNVNEHHNVFANAGYYARQPFFDDLFMNYRNDVNPDVGNEGILGVELGYGYRSDFIDVDLNAYMTQWRNRQIRETGDYDGGGSNDDVALFENVAQNHMGIELEFEMKPIDPLSIRGFASVGNWVYAGDVDAFVYDENQQPIPGAPATLYLDGVRVGNAAQTSFGILVDYRIIKGLSVDADWRFYDRLFAAIDPSAFGTEDHEGSLQLPSFNLLDAGVSYKLYLKGRQSLNFRFNANNLLNRQYISESRTNIHANGTDEEWNGVNVNNSVYFGNGITWNLSIAYRF